MCSYFELEWQLKQFVDATSELSTTFYGEGSMLSVCQKQVGPRLCAAYRLAKVLLHVNDDKSSILS